MRHQSVHLTLPFTSQGSSWNTCVKTPPRARRPHSSLPQILNRTKTKMGFSFADLYRAPEINPVNKKARAVPMLNPINPYGRVFFFSWFGFMVAFWAWYSMSIAQFIVMVQFMLTGDSSSFSTIGKRAKHALFSQPGRSAQVSILIMVSRT